MGRLELLRQQAVEREWIKLMVDDPLEQELSAGFAEFPEHCKQILIPSDDSLSWVPAPSWRQVVCGQKVQPWNPRNSWFERVGFRKSGVLEAVSRSRSRTCSRNSRDVEL